MSRNASASVSRDPLAEYRRLDEEIDRAQRQEYQAYHRVMRLRWEFGKRLVAERMNGRLPDGRLDEVAEAIGKSRAEVNHRMRFYEAHPTDGMRSNALEHQPPWRDVVTSLTREPRREVINGDGDDAAITAALVETGRAYRDNQETVTRLQMEYDDDVRQHGPNPLSSRPISGEAEQLRDGLQMMDAGAKKILKVADLDLVIPMARVIAELPPSAVKRQLREVHHAYSAVHLALMLSTRKPIDTPLPSDAIQLETEPAADIEVVALPLPPDEEEDD